jgi:SSS family solute:Na+ symporter
VLLGLGLVLSPAYWCTNQAIMQRCLGARTEWDGKASMMFAAMAKTFVPLLIVLPGFFALLMAPEHLGLSDQALPWVVKNLLPPGVSGLLFVAFIAALQSSVSSTLNSASVMVTRDILGVIRSKRLDDAAELRMGRMITIAALAAGILCAPLTAQFRGIYVYVQQLLSFFQGPVFALLLMGILFKRITPRAGLWSLLLGLGFAALLGLAGLNMLYMAFWSFVMSVALLFMISAFTRPKSASELENLTYTSVVKEVVDV